jgi:hypothetical protein
MLNLKCSLCIRLKAFSKITDAWGHIVHAHKEVADDVRLAEVRRMGFLARPHRIANSHKGKHDPTRVKLDQIIDAGFSWPIVLEWGLRP